MACGVTDPASCIPAVVGTVAGAAGGSILEMIQGWVTSATDWTVKNLMTAWLKTPTVQVDGASSVSTWLADKLWFLTAAAAVMSVLIGAYRLATTQEWNHGRELAQALVRMTLVSASAGFVISTGIALGDAITDELVASTKLDFSQTVSILVLNEPLVKIILGIVAVLAMFFQVLIMLARNSMLVFEAGTLPLVAAASNSSSGHQAFQKNVGWTLAFLLYKPVAAIIYVGAFKLVSGNRSPVEQLTGIAAMILALVALPGLMKALVPAVGPMTGSNAGAMAVAATGAMAATGAVAATGGLGGLGFGGAQAASAPIGAPPVGPPPPAPGPPPMSPAPVGPVDGGGGAPAPVSPVAGPSASGSDRNVSWRDLGRAGDAGARTGRAAHEAEKTIGEDI